MSEREPEPLTTPLRDLLPEDTPAEEIARLARADAILRDTPAPPEAAPETLGARIARIPAEVETPKRRARRTRRRPGLPTGRWVPYAAAAAACAAAFAIGFVVRGGGQSEAAPEDVVTLNSTPRGPGDAEMVIEVLPRDAAGNWALLADVSGLEPVGDDQYYELWLTKDRKVVVSCGRFRVDANGAAQDVWLNAPYRFKDYDDWVVTKESPNGKPKRSAWLLRGPISTPI